MEIRKATQKDVPEIIRVLRMSLGESKLPKSEEIWRYKHFENPFGQSIVLVAVLEYKIVGVRALMQWQWQYGSAPFTSLRAVDTATLPGYRGQGVFRELTLKAMEIACEKGKHFVFNTPNSQSMPGYLKMGWAKVTRLPVQLFPVNPIYWKRDNNFPCQNNTKISPSRLYELTIHYNNTQGGGGKFFVPKTIEYLDWRYFRNPLQDYLISADEDYFLAAYVKIHKNVKELRISESIYIDKESKAKLKNKVMIWAKFFGVQFISIADSSVLFKSFSLRGNFGPILTVRNLNLERQKMNEILKIRNWDYSLGDLELF